MTNKLTPNGNGWRNAKKDNSMEELKKQILIKKTTITI
jgi:hypothetical protein